MGRRRIAWLVWFIVNVVALAILLIVLFANPPWARYGMDDEEITLFITVASYVAFNWYFMFRARKPDDWFEETLPGLWIRARKTALRQEIEAVGRRKDG